MDPHRRFPTLRRKDVIRISKELKAKGRKLPKHGYCARLDDGREVCRDKYGYYFVGMKR